MKKLSFIILAFALTFGQQLTAQDATKPTDSKNWDIGLGLGLDFTQFLQINPKVGSGSDKLGFGSAINLFAKYNKDRLAWDNMASWNYGLQRIGAGQIRLLNNQLESIPWQKNIDELRLGSKVGYKTAENSKFFYTFDFGFLSQLTSTYDGNLTRSLIDDNQTPISKLFSPATITLSLGMDYKATKNLSIYYSPIAYKAIIVADDDIASTEAVDTAGVGLGRSVHGNPWRSATDFDNTFNQFGSLLRFEYINKYFEDNFIVKSRLELYSNYLNNPQNIDVDWNNEFSINLPWVKGLSLGVLLNFFYDDDVLVQVTDWDAVGGVTGGLGKRLSMTEQILIKYQFGRMDKK